MRLSDEIYENSKDESEELKLIDKEEIHFGEYPKSFDEFMSEVNEYYDFLSTSYSSIRTKELFYDDINFVELIRSFSFSSKPAEHSIANYVFHSDFNDKIFLKEIVACICYMGLKADGSIEKRISELLAVAWNAFDEFIFEAIEDDVDISHCCPAIYNAVDDHSINEKCQIFQDSVNRDIDDFIRVGFDGILKLRSLEKQKQRGESIGFAIMIKDYIKEEISEKYFIKSVETTLNTKTTELDNLLDTYKPHKLVEELDKYVYGNKLVKQQLALSVYSHLKDARYDLKNNKVIQIAGPSGCGKTELIRSLKKIIGDVIPVYIRDAGSLSTSGFKGTSIGEMIGSIIPGASSINNAIIVIDEFDKIIKPLYDSEGCNYNAEKQGELLKCLEGDPIMNGSSEIKLINCMFILIGAYSDLTTKVKGKSIAGFTREKQIENQRMSNVVNVEDMFRQYGMEGELARRITNYLFVDKLSKEDMEQIFRSNLESGIFSKMREELLLVDGIVLRYQDDIVPVLAEYGEKKDLGVSGMYNIFRKAVDDLSYEALKTGVKNIDVSINDINRAVGIE